MVAASADDGDRGTTVVSMAVAVATSVAVAVAASVAVARGSIAAAAHVSGGGDRGRRIRGLHVGSGLHRGRIHCISIKWQARGQTRGNRGSARCASARRRF